MALIGLENLHYAKITSESESEIIYEEPKRVAPAIQVELSVDKESKILYGDNIPQENISVFKGGTVKIKTTDLPQEFVALALGKKQKDGVTMSNSADDAPYLALGFCANKSNGQVKFVWLYKIKFSEPSDDYETQGDSIEFKVPELEGTILSKPNGDWKIDFVGAKDSEIATNWFKKVQQSVDIE